MAHKEGLGLATTDSNRLCWSLTVRKQTQLVKLAGKKGTGYPKVSVQNQLPPSLSSWDPGNLNSLKEKMESF